MIVGEQVGSRSGELRESTSVLIVSSGFCLGTRTAYLVCLRKERALSAQPLKYVAFRKLTIRFQKSIA